jgi:co-chaperonin GroES (HSP10)
MNLEPIGDRILIDVINEKTKAGLILPKSNSRYCKAVVIASGAGHLTSTGVRIDMGFHPGDTLLILSAAIEEFEIDGTKYAMVTGNHVVAVLERA